jgi:hypothetical protein
MTTPTLPDALEVHVEVSGRPLAGAWVAVILGMSRKNPHDMIGGPTDENGDLTVPLEVIERNVRRAIETSPMDYVGLHMWDGSIRVEALSRERVKGILAAVDLWGHPGSLESEDRVDQLKDYLRALEPDAGSQITVSVDTRPTPTAEVVGVDALA